jgi:O-antigen/teichoic acid export membrane protein
VDGQAIISVSAAVVALTQLLKWAGLPDKVGPLAVLALAFFGVTFWGYSVGTFERTQAFAYFAGWIAVATSAAGTFGFTRAGVAAVTAAKPLPPPPETGAGGGLTEKP